VQIAGVGPQNARQNGPDHGSFVQDCSIENLKPATSKGDMKSICFSGELANFTTKIITLFEFINFVSEVSRLQ
jgi:hypothetical protein